MFKSVGEIDFSKDSVYVVRGGKLYKVEQPSSGFGEQSAVWINNKIDRIENKEIGKFLNK